jgi:hypothetical protein
MESASLLPGVLSNLLRELVDGPTGQVAFILNPGDRGLIASLAQLSAAQASTRIDGHSSVAAHVQHLRFGLHLLNRWAGGDANAFAGASYAESWSHQQVNDTEWRELREAFERAVRDWRSRLETPPSAWDATTLSGFVSSVAHTAYHMGAIRQLVPAAAGPPAKD